jgi:hypothetical protein
MGIERGLNRGMGLGMGLGISKEAEEGDSVSVSSPGAACARATLMTTPPPQPLSVPHSPPLFPLWCHITCTPPGLVIPITIAITITVQILLFY